MPNLEGRGIQIRRFTLEGVYFGCGGSVPWLSEIVISITPTAVGGTTACFGTRFGRLRPARRSMLVFKRSANSSTGFAEIFFGPCVTFVIVPLAKGQSSPNN
jgi:hypothetical protein